MVPMVHRLKVAFGFHKLHFGYKNIDNKNARFGDGMQNKIAKKMHYASQRNLFLLWDDRHSGTDCMHAGLSPCIVTNLKNTCCLFPYGLHCGVRRRSSLRTNWFFNLKFEICTAHISQNSSNVDFRYNYYARIWIKYKRCTEIYPSESKNSGWKILRSNDDLVWFELIRLFLYFGDNNALFIPTNSF